MHLFYDCFMVKKLIDNFRNHYGLAGGTEESFKKFFLQARMGKTTVTR